MKWLGAIDSFEMGSYLLGGIAPKAAKYTPWHFYQFSLLQINISYSTDCSIPRRPYIASDVIVETHLQLFTQNGLENKRDKI